jgi:hypothetical protein
MVATAAGTLNGMKSLIITAVIVCLAFESQAKIGVEYQMQLGNPTGAKADSSNHEHRAIVPTATIRLCLFRF